MGVEVATTFVQWSAQPIVPHSPSPSQTLASAISSPCSKRLISKRDGGSFVCRFLGLNRSALFGSQSSKLHGSKSCKAWELSRTTKVQFIRRTCSASVDSFSDEKFSKKMQELALKFRVMEDEGDENNTVNDSEPEIIHDSIDNQVHRNSYSGMDGEAKLGVDSVEPPWQEMVHVSSLERKANSVDLPLSLRIIKRKLLWKEGFREAGDLAYCSVKKAFSSMVFMIRELQSFSLQMRELLFYEDLQGILHRVQKEMHASFVWLFQQVFSPTPTLMVHIMILLANFTVFSMGTNAAIAASPTMSTRASTEMDIISESQDGKDKQFDFSLMKTFSVSPSNGKTSIGGNSGGDGKVRPAAGGTDGGGWFDGSHDFRTIVPDGVSQLSSSTGSTTKESEPLISGPISTEEELGVWDSIVDAAERMRGLNRDEVLDHDTMSRFVSPVEVKIEPDDYADYFKTDLLYQIALAQEPRNSLLLANYAQFLSLVAHDYDRAEEYFKRATEFQPPDAEVYSKYANFLWRARNDLDAAEETFLEAISSDPTNSYYSANYAHFLWNTGGEDTCFPLSSPETTQEA